ncbi:MAG TPA: HNH endonuclease [Clostridiaceae bacterium]
METKVCSECGIEKPVEMFGKLKSEKDGLAKKCKICKTKQYKQWYEANRESVNERMKLWREENKEHVAEYNKQYGTKWYEENKERSASQQKQYREANKEHKSERMKLWRQENKEKLSEYMNQYYEQNKIKLRELGKQYQKNNPEIYRKIRQTRRARKNQLFASLTIEQWEKIKIHFNNKCAYCGKEHPLEQEHFIPLSKHGEYTHNNIIPACRSCNSSKGVKDFKEWYPKHRYYNKKREKFILEFLNIQDDKQQLILAI